jgi:hypothetical protein
MEGVERSQASQQLQLRRAASKKAFMLYGVGWSLYVATRGSMLVDGIRF